MRAFVIINIIIIIIINHHLHHYTNFMWCINHGVFMKIYSTKYAVFSEMLI